MRHLFGSLLGSKNTMALIQANSVLSMSTFFKGFTSSSITLVPTRQMSRSEDTPTLLLSVTKSLVEYCEEKKKNLTISFSNESINFSSYRALKS